MLTIFLFIIIILLKTHEYHTEHVPSKPLNLQWLNRQKRKKKKGKKKRRPKRVFSFYFFKENDRTDGFKSTIAKSWFNLWAFPQGPHLNATIFGIILSPSTIDYFKERD